MNENEAIERIKYRMHTVEQVAGENGMEDLEMAIKALEEIQQYRETGHTPAMVRDLIRGYKTEHKQNMKLVNELEDYQMIGTPEECLRNKDFLDFLADKMNPNDFEVYLQIYNTLEEKGCEE